ncbi:MAG: hypothetical protein AAF050_16395 [Cyanobacteria bacterium J06649_5]
MRSQLKSLNRALEGAEARVRAATAIDIESLCLFRIVFGLFTLCLWWKSYRWIGSVPETFFAPHFFTLPALFPGFPPAFVFYGLDIGIALLVMTLTIGAFTRFSTRGLLVLFTIAESFHYSLGKIDHEILYLCVLLVMSFKDWGRYFSIDSLRSGGTTRGEQAHRQADRQRLDNLWILAVFVTFGFFSAGFGKALSWVDFDLTTSGFLSWLYRGYFTEGNDRLLAPLLMKINFPLLWELLDISAVIFELGFLWAMFSRRSWYVWLTIACSFHLANCLLLNIPFVQNAIAYLAFVPWSQVTIFRHIVSEHLRKVLFALLAVWALAMALSASVGRTFYGLAFYIGEASPVPISYLGIICLLWAGCLGLFCWVNAQLPRFFHKGTFQAAAEQSSGKLA